MDIMKEALAIEAQVIAWQEHFHVNAELSQKEEHTVEVIIRHLEKLGIEYVNVPDGGVLGFIRGGKPGKTVLLRADIDALDMDEAPKNDKFPKRVLSKYPGIAHTCGHDAHTAMLMGAGQILQTHAQDLEGDVVLYFERGEEHGEGDLHLMGYIQQNNIHIDGAWALHMRPNLPAGTIGTREGGINAASCSWGLKLEKMEGNPFTLSDCAVGIMHNLNTARMREVSPYESLTITPCKVQITEDSCIVAGSCRFNEREKVGVPIHDVLENFLQSTCAAYGYTPVRCKVVGPTRNMVNHPVAYRIATESIGAAIGQERVVPGELSLGGESFSTLTSYYPSIMAHVGNYNPEKGTTAQLHSPFFEVDPEVLKYGVAATVAYALGFLAHKEPIAFTPFVGTIREFYGSLNL